MSFMREQQESAAEGDRAPVPFVMEKNRQEERRNGNLKNGTGMGKSREARCGNGGGKQRGGRRIRPFRPYFYRQDFFPAIFRSRIIRLLRPQRNTAAEKFFGEENKGEDA